MLDRRTSMRCTFAVALMIASSGCGSDAVNPPTPVDDDAGTGGGGGSEGMGGDMGPTVGACDCAPGEVPLADGTCESDPIPPSLCIGALEPDGDGSCRPVGPATPCTGDQMAAAGETVCHPVSPCGAGTWGDIPIEVDTQFVDGAFGGASDGTAAAPWKTLPEAIAAASPGAIVAIAAGTYDIGIVLTKPLRFWGKCAAEVELHGIDTSSAALRIDTAGVGTTELHDLAITGNNRGVLVDFSNSLFDRVWIHDTAGAGIDILNTDLNIATTVTRSLISNTDNYGIKGFGGALVVEDSHVRDIQAPVSSLGHGITFEEAISADAYSPMTLRRVRLERLGSFGVRGLGVVLEAEDIVIVDVAPATAILAAGALSHQGGFAQSGLAPANIQRLYIENGGAGGLLLAESDATVETVVINGTNPGMSPDIYGDGIFVATYGIAADAVMSRATIRHATVDDVETTGILVQSAELHLESLRIRDVAPYHIDGSAGRGISYEVALMGASKGSITGVTVERATEAGIAALGADISVDHVLVRDVQPAPSGSFGRGITFETDGDGMFFPAVGAVSCSLVDGAYELGVGTLGGTVTIDASIARNVRESPSGRYGAGFISQLSTLSNGGASMSVTKSEVARCEGFGALAISAQMMLSEVRIDDIATQPQAGIFGDGVAAVVGTFPSGIDLTDVRISGSARAGAATFGTVLRLEGVTLECNAIDLNGEIIAASEPFVEDVGDNACGCGGEARACKLLSSGLTSPQPL